MARLLDVRVSSAVHHPEHRTDAEAVLEPSYRQRWTMPPVAWAASRGRWAGAAAPPTEYLAGFRAGWEAGQVAALALAIGMLSGESPTAILEDLPGERAS